MLSSREILPWNAARPRIIALVACDYNPEHLSNALLGRSSLNRSPFAWRFCPPRFFGKFETDLAMLKF
jgi:hypothetical protein